MSNTTVRPAPARAVNSGWAAVKSPMNGPAISPLEVNSTDLTVMELLYLFTMWKSATERMFCIFISSEDESSAPAFIPKSGKPGPARCALESLPFWSWQGSTVKQNADGSEFDA